jgi:ammonia channel protein AmtB
VTLLLFTLVAAAGAVVGLVNLWRRREPVLIALSTAGLVGLTICAFTAEIWFGWFGFARGDGQVFIGYYLFGLIALGVSALAVLGALIVLALRPRMIGEKA